MTVMNIDELAEKQFGCIEVILDGVSYKITVLPSDMLDSVVGNPEDPRVIRQTFAKMVGKKEEDFKKTDFRKLVSAVSYVMEQLRTQVEAYQSKNVPGESVS